MSSSIGLEGWVRAERGRARRASGPRRRTRRRVAQTTRSASDQQLVTAALERALGVDPAQVQEREHRRRGAPARALWGECAVGHVPRPASSRALHRRGHGRWLDL
jgi:hypothetical protein